MHEEYETEQTLDAAPGVLAHADLPSVHLCERVAPDHRERPARLHSTVRADCIEYCIVIVTHLLTFTRVEKGECAKAQTQVRDISKRTSRLCVLQSYLQYRAQFMHVVYEYD